MITSPTNSKIKYVKRLQTEKRFRLREQAFVIEGTRWLKELFKYPHLQPQFVLYTEAWYADHQAILQQLTTPSHLIADALMETISNTITPSGVLAVLPIQPCPLPTNLSFILILDGVKTPGNLGTMLRTAGAAGVEAVLLAPNCVDAYNPKVVRGSMGTHLRLPIHIMTWEEIATFTADMNVWLATVNNAKPYTAVNWQQPTALVIGSEAHGVSPEAEQLANGRLTIPMHQQTESLNAAVATGIILFEAVRQKKML